MVGVVIDTNVLVSALWSIDSNPYKVVEKVFTNDIMPYYNQDILEEYTEVLTRAKFGFSTEQVIGLLREIMEKGVLAESDASDSVFLDESDKVFYDLAKTHNVILITGNKKHYPDEPFVQSPLEYLQKDGFSDNNTT